MHRAVTMSRNGQIVPECWPARPARFPASERSMHGKDAVTRSRPRGRSPMPRSWMSPKRKCSPLNRRRYISSLRGAMSLAKTHCQPSGSIASRTRPIPAKNSAKRPAAGASLSRSCSPPGREAESGTASAGVSAVFSDLSREVSNKPYMLLAAGRTLGRSDRVGGARDYTGAETALGATGGGRSGRGGAGRRSDGARIDRLPMR